MSRIRQLDTFTVNQIAAGEVIERPVSVVKELIENALDAGAGTVRVEVRDGGLKQIRVTDDGSGMSPEEAALSIQRHATSKLRQIEDLDQLTTLGFRGEALPSIASVSKTEILTREHSQNQGTQLRISGDSPPSVAPAGAPPGTVVTVEELFFNTPARLKFLKTPGYESGLIHDLVIQFAIGFPEIAFKFENQGKLILDTTGVGHLEELVELFYGPDGRHALVYLDGQASRAHVYGAVTRPPYARSNRKGYHFLINGRKVVSRELTRAVENACYMLLPKGRFALAVLRADLPGEWVDVNVHPGKLEVRLRDTALSGALSTMIKDAFSKQSRTPQYQSPPYSRAFSFDPKVQDGWRDFYQTEPGDAAYEAGRPDSPDGGLSAGPAGSASGGLPAWLTGSASGESPAGPAGAASGEAPRSRAAGDGRPYMGSASGEPSGLPAWLTGSASGEPSDGSAGSASGEALRSRAAGDGPPDKGCAPGEPTGLPAGLTGSAPGGPSAGPANPAWWAPSEGWTADSGGPATVPETRVLPPLKAIGQLRNMFILAEGEAGLYILDQHVVHERILYEQFERKHEQGALEAQMLLTPVSLELTVMEEELLLKQLPLLEDFGVIIEPFGARHYLIRSAPSGLDKDPEVFFRDFMEELEAGTTNQKPVDAKRDLLISMSCKKAVKAHWTLSLQEMQSLIDQLRLTRFPLICPHGRPILYELPYARLLQIFGRK
ncbi:MAG: DNA mismatch repair endonuclease MutL [Peptococcaceae bacterium]|jgi:DNA mismatch repair protein MutL|nr:DNA mismatch repair endonuclease MutL [Peptococcaceae bacterium]